MFLNAGLQIVRQTFQLCVTFILFWMYEPCKSLILAHVLQEQHKTHPRMLNWNVSEYSSPSSAVWIMILKNITIGKTKAI
jgi:hypothetical protein